MNQSATVFSPGGKISEEQLAESKKVIPETVNTKERREGFFKLDESLISSKNEQESDLGKVICNEHKHLIESI